MDISFHELFQWLAKFRTGEEKVRGRTATVVGFTVNSLFTEDAIGSLWAIFEGDGFEQFSNFSQAETDVFSLEDLRNFISGKSKPQFFFMDELSEEIRKKMVEELGHYDCKANLNGKPIKSSICATSIDEAAVEFAEEIRRDEKIDFSRLEVLVKPRNKKGISLVVRRAVRESFTVEDESDQLMEGS